MRKYRVVLSVLVMLAAVVLSACQSGGGAAAESSSEKTWNLAVADGSTIRDYVNTHIDELDMAEFETEAGDENLSLSAQFKAIVLLTELEYQKDMMDKGEDIYIYDSSAVINDSENTAIRQGDDVFAAEYPVSSVYAESFLAKAETAGAEFWEAVEDARSPYNFLMNLFAAADSVSSETLAALITECPADYSSSLTDAVDRWLKDSPKRLAEVGEVLIASGHYDDKIVYNLTSDLFGSDSDELRFESIDQGLAYIRFIRTKMIPMLEENAGLDIIGGTANSSLTGGVYYTTGMTPIITEVLNLSTEGAEAADEEADQDVDVADADESTEGSDPAAAESIDLEGKKVIGLYYNPTDPDDTKFPDSPAALRILGDFMLTIPDELAAESLEDADYCLVLTANYVLGDYYQMNSSEAELIRQVYSFTSIDLYEAATGRHLRNLGTVREEAPDSVYFMSNETMPDLVYPELFPADDLLFIYQNINDMEQYVDMLESYQGNQQSLAIGETAHVGKWDVLVESFDVVETFDDSIYRYTANEGEKFLRCRATVTNNSNEELTLFPMHYSIGYDMIARIKDAEGNSYEPSFGLMLNDYFNSDSFAAGESISKYILFEMPEAVADGDGELWVEFSLAPHLAGYRLR